MYENVTEEAFRMQAYLKSLREVKKHQKLHAEGKVTYEIGINEFSDMVSTK